jgi:hypothetical protein
MEVLNLYITDEWTAQIVTDERGIVLDCQITFKPTSEFARRIAKRARHYKQRPRVELPEDLQTHAAQDAGAWV